MNLRQTLAASIAVAWLAGCGSSPKGPAPTAAPPKRIVLVTIDTWRADALGASGSGRVKTPVLDAFAAGGLYVPKAWSSATLTATSHATILTGLQPYHHGVRDNHGFKLSASVPTLAGKLSEAGYATAAFVSAHPLARVSGLNSGFTVYDDHCAPGELLSVVPRWRPGAETIDAARAWLRTAPDRYFLWVHLYEPHDRYVPPEPYLAAYKDAPYFGEVAYVDELVGRLKSALGPAGEQDALWIITGDHGEALGDHGEATHSLFVYDATARVPLIVWAPGRIAPGRSEFARLVDVAPTILAMAGVAQPAGLDGASILTTAEAAPRAAYVETMYPSLNFGVAPVRALSDGTYKVIDVPQKEVYDLSTDPAEARNRAGETQRPQVEALRAALAALPDPAPQATEKPGAEEVEALRSLGYIGAGGEYAVGQQGMDPKVFAPLYMKLNTVRGLVEERRFAEAKPLYKQLLAAFPRSSTLLCEAGFVELALGNPNEAETYMQLAVQRNGENAHALLGMANLAIGRRDYAAAEGFLLEVVKLDPDDVEANFNLGALYYQALKQPAKAVGYWERFVELQPEDREAARIRQLIGKIKAEP